METQVDEIADGIFRLSTFNPDAGLPFNQYLVRAEQPLLFHTGFHSLFPLVSEAVASVVPVDQLRWITFGHVEGDESGAMNDFLEAAPGATVAHGVMGCLVQVNEAAIRPPHMLNDGDVLDLGGKRVRVIETPHVPHAWDAHVLFEETTGTLLCGDLFTAYGNPGPTTTDDIVAPALAAEAMGSPTALTPMTAPRVRGLTSLEPKTLALMHGAAFTGDCSAALRDLADGYESLLQDALAARG